MSDPIELPTTHVALYCYRRSPRYFLEFLILRHPENDHFVWLAYEADVPPEADDAEIARQAVARFGASDVVALDYRYPVPLWGSNEANVLPQESGNEEVYCAVVPLDASDGYLDDAMRWVTVMDGVSLLRYPEHVEALLRAATLAESAIQRSA